MHFRRSKPNGRCRKTDFFKLKMEFALQGHWNKVASVKKSTPRLGTTRLPYSGTQKEHRNTEFQVGGGATVTAWKSEAKLGTAERGKADLSPPSCF